MTLVDRVQWITKMKSVVDGPKNRKTETSFHKLILATPPNADKEMVDAIMESFLKPFDSSVMQICITALSGINFEQYYESLFKILPRLLNQDPDSALCLLDYPGFELKHKHIKAIVQMIKKSDPSGALKTEIDHQINHWNLNNDEPWFSIYHSV